MSDIDLERWARARIRQAREHAGWNKREMARRMNMASSSWLAIEDGDRELDLSLLVTIAEKTGVSWRYFFPFERPPDLVAALLAQYPDMPAPQVQSIVSMAKIVYDQFKSSLDSVRPHATPSGDTSDSSEN